MLGLPQKTELRKKLDKTLIYSTFNLDKKQQALFDSDISLLYIVNDVSEYSTGIKKGENVSSIRVIQVKMKNKEYNDANITRLFRLIDNKIILLLEFQDEVQLVVYHLKLFKTDWHPRDDIKLTLSGLNMDTVYENIVTQIGDFQIQDGNTFEEQIVADEQQAKLQKEIARLEKQARAEKQPKKKFELVSKIKFLNKQLSGLYND